MCHKIDLKTLDKTRYSLDVLSYSLPKFDFNTLSSQIDENGEIQVFKIIYEEKTLNKSMFLYWIQVDRETGERFIEGINDANSYLLDLLVNKSLQDVSIYSRGLIHYFSKLAEWLNGRMIGGICPTFKVNGQHIDSRNFLKTHIDLAIKKSISQRRPPKPT